MLSGREAMAGDGSEGGREVMEEEERAAVGRVGGWV